MTTLDQTEVLVVGAGPVGMFTALLLDFKASPATTGTAAEWVRRRAERIVGSLPASGGDLACLLKQLAIDF